jgi:hypothetical protein
MGWAEMSPYQKSLVRQLPVTMPRLFSTKQTASTWFPQGQQSPLVTEDDEQFQDFAVSGNDPSDSSFVEAIPFTSREQGKAILLQLGASLDRGQAYNPTSGSYYGLKMATAKATIASFIEKYSQAPSSLESLRGEWELVFSTVAHGIFRSSPFFLAIQEAYAIHGNAPEQALLFFKLHELQTCSWGASKVGRVAQTITQDATIDAGFAPDAGWYLYSEFDTSLFSLTVIPILGWFKLLPTFGGCVITAAKIMGLEKSSDNTIAELKMEVDYTTAKKVPGLSGLGDWTWQIRVPVGKIWQWLPWNQGRKATCRVLLPYVDDDFRIVQDTSGDYFVYTRPVVPRPLILAT